MRKWIVVLSVLSLALFIAGEPAAAPVSVETARQVAVNWMNERTGGDFESSDILAHYAGKQDGATVYYRFNFHPRGWAIVSAEDAAYPVIGYSRTGTPSDPSHPPAFEQWMARAGQAISRAKRARSKPPGEIAALWERLSADTSGYSAKAPRRKQTVGPLLQTRWHQKAPYNAFCPQDSDGNGGHAAAGCAAIAMAQVLKYHNYPAAGSGSHYYPHAEYGGQYANFGATTYQWENMPNSTTTSSSDLARLIYHCAVSLEMDFGPSYSSASLSDAEEALPAFFKYDSGIILRKKPEYSDTTWRDMVKAELDAGRPLLYRGEENNSGHAFVCDGYDDSGYFHFNWGWGGIDNGYFYLNNLTPSNGDLTEDQEALFNVKPPDQPVLSVTPGSEEVSDGAGISTFTIANSGDGTLSWSISESAHWLSVSPLSGTGDQTITVSYEASPGWARTGVITITASNASNVQYFLLNQGEGAGSLTWQTSKAEAMALARSQGKMVLLMAGSESSTSTSYMRDTVCESIAPPIKPLIQQHYVPWYCDTNTSSEHYSYTGGLGGYTLPLICCIDPDDSDNYLSRSTEREDTEAFYNRLQSHIPQAEAILSVTPSLREVSAVSGTTSFQVTNTGTGTMDWSASGDENWFSFSPASGTGDSTIWLSYAANTGVTRTGHLTISAANSQNSPVQVDIRQASGTGQIAGDIDGNGAVELRDIILALQVCADLSILSDIHPEADVNNDDRIGMEEAIHDAAYLISH